MSLTTTMITTFLITTGSSGLYDKSIITNATTTIIPNKETKRLSSLEIEYSKLYRELGTYSELTQNWDGYNGIKPTDEVIQTTKQFLNILKSQEIIYPKIMVAGSGQIALFWKNKKNYLEIDFDEENKFSFFYKLNNKVYGRDDLVLSDNLPTEILESITYIHKISNTETSRPIIGTAKKEVFLINSLVA
jgi:hypothetical protein